MKNVYCKALGGGIPESCCKSEQGIKECRDCNSPVRRCVICSDHPVHEPSSGTCNMCLRRAVAKQFCIRCRKRRGQGNDQLCSSCRTVLVTAGLISTDARIARTDRWTPEEIKNLLQRFLEGSR